ncbi:MAG: hypothetical protein KDH17_00730 [Rhodocyclaceae bacterium]|nr:hypothetical protein [Rhodocyclaceae bacterium]
MLILRFLGVACLIGAAVSLVAYLLSGDRRYLRWILRFAVGTVVLFVALLLLERILMPIV